MAVLLISALVFGFSAYGWVSFRDLQKGLSTAPVIGFNNPDGATDILLVGNDSRTDAHGSPLPEKTLVELKAGDNDGGLTDTLILVRIPNDGTRAVAISLPRDLYVQMPDGFGRHKLNSAYARGKNHTVNQLSAQGADPEAIHEQSVLAGRKLLVRTVENLAGVSIDHYAEINLLGFALLTEAVGGVEVCLRAPVRDRFSGADFEAGRQLIAGPDALAFVRQRHGLPRGDLDRVVRQQVFLASLANRVLSAGTLTNPNRIRQLIDATQQSLVLDDTFDVLDFASRLQNLAAGNVEFMTVPVVGDAESPTEGAVLQVDEQAVLAFVDAAIRPPPAAPAAAGEFGGPGRPGGLAGSGDPGGIQVHVLNASGVSGLAAAVSDQLAAGGLAAGSVTNAHIRMVSLVRYATGERQGALRVAAALNELPIEEDPNLPPGTVQVYLGLDYDGPGSDGEVGGPLTRRGDSSAEGPATAIGGDIAHQPPAGQTTAFQPPTPPVVASDVPCVD